MGGYHRHQPNKQSCHSLADSEHTGPIALSVCPSRVEDGDLAQLGQPCLSRHWCLLQGRVRMQIPSKQRAAQLSPCHASTPRSADDQSTSQGKETHSEPCALHT